MSLCFVTTYIGPPHLSDISNNFKKVDGCDYLIFTNLNKDQVKDGWDVITIDLEEFNYLKSAVKISRYFKFMLHEYMKKIGRDYDFVFYCDSYKYPDDKVNWKQICDNLESSETGIIQYNHRCFGPDISLNKEMDQISRCRKDTKANMQQTRIYLKNINGSVDMNKKQYYENSIIGFHFKNEYAINQCNDFWKYYVDCPTYRDQPLWNFLYLQNNKKPCTQNKLESRFHSSPCKSRSVNEYKAADAVITKK